MKTYISLLLIFALSIFQSCNNNTSTKVPEESKHGIVKIGGTWTLIKANNNGKRIDYEGKPTAVSLTLKENGYFIFFDKITDPKISNSGVDEIQVRYKGQYEYVGNTLKMNHFVDDSLITETYIVEDLSEEELVLKDEKTKKTQFYKK